jgi:hypothetical protein
LDKINVAVEKPSLVTIEELKKYLSKNNVQVMDVRTKANTITDI